MESIKSKEELEAFFTNLGLIDNEHPENNAQFLAHSTGTKGGIDAVQSILQNGLWIKREDKLKNSNSYVDAGLMSTSEIKNNPNDNTVNFTELSSNSVLFWIDENVRLGIVSIIPQWFDDIYLGKVFYDFKDKTRSCALDYYEIDTLPPEFIAGTYAVNTTTHEIEFVPNEKFFALSEENYLSAKTKLKQIIANKEEDILSMVDGFRALAMERYKDPDKVNEHMLSMHYPKYIQYIYHNLDDLLAEQKRRKENYKAEVLEQQPRKQIMPTNTSETETNTDITDTDGFTV